MSTPQREITLDEWMAQLPSFHLARRQLAEQLAERDRRISELEKKLADGWTHPEEMKQRLEKAEARVVAVEAQCRDITHERDSFRGLYKHATEYMDWHLKARDKLNALGYGPTVLVGVDCLYRDMEAAKALAEKAEQQLAERERRIANLTQRINVLENTLRMRVAERDQARAVLGEARRVERLLEIVTEAANEPCQCEPVSNDPEDGMMVCRACLAQKAIKEWEARAALAAGGGESLSATAARVHRVLVDEFPDDDNRPKSVDCAIRWLAEALAAGGELDESQEKPNASP